jgi:hypothetical protein
MIGNDPLFTRSFWQSYNQSPDWTLNPDRNGHAIVYVKFMDAEGNESETYHAEVDVRRLDQLGHIHLRVLLDTRLSLGRPLIFALPTLMTQPGALVMVQDDPGLPPAYTDPDGFATLENLPVGRYRLFIQYPDYKPLSIEDIQVVGGQTVELGDQMLTPWMVYLPVVKK